jgi:UPF0755 protein
VVSRRSFRIALAIVIGTLLAGGAVAGYYAVVAYGYPDRRHDGAGRQVRVEIEPGMSLTGIARRLDEAGVIDRPTWFRLWARKRATDIRAGTYTLRDDMTPRQVLTELLEGVPEVNVSVTIKEGWNMLEVFAAFEGAGVGEEPGALERLCRDRAFLDRHGIEGDTCDGYLFPDTYRFKVPTPPEAVLERLIEQHRVVWDRVRRANAKSVEALEARLGWSDRELLVLASIVEKEAVVDGERARIAQVFINRLTTPSFTPKRLETDPTIRYGCLVPVVKSAACQVWDATDRLHRKQLDDEANPYNTYQHEGLPPGPIGNPGRKSLEAAAHPDGSKFFFFVSKNDGTHVFSKTHAEHTKWVNQFQR